MKKYTVGQGKGLAKLGIGESEIRDPGPGEVMVRWHATSLNFHDYLVATGGIPVSEGRIPMSDGAGEVVELGEGTHRLKQGDKVMGLFFPDWVDGRPTPSKIRHISGESSDGFMCEFSIVAEDSLTRIPEGWSYETAACLPTAGLTAWNALFNNGSLRMGEKVLIEGTGGMSLCAFILAKAAGCEVYATTSSDHKAERLKEWGAAAVVNYKNDPLWGKTLYKASGGGMDHVMDAGGGSTMKQSIEACKMGGHIHAIGILGNGRKGEITFPKLFFKFIKMEGLAVGNRRMQEDMVTAIESNRLNFDTLVDKQFSFDQLSAAFQYQLSGQQMGKIVIRW